MSSLVQDMRSLLFICFLMLSSLATASDYVTYLHPDVQGSPVVATDEQGQVIWRESYAPWGQREIKDTASVNPALGSKTWYTGKEEEEALGLYYYGARWYSPDIGQLYSIDPAPVTLENPRSFGRYLYANNNPIRYTDPDGRSPIDVAFLAYDIGRLGMAAYSGVGVGAAAVDVGLSLVGVISPVPGTGQVLKTARTADRVADAARAAAKGCCCFVAGTPVLTSEGLKPIETIQAGTLVPARDPDTGVTRLQKVTDFIITEGKPLYALTLRNGQGQTETLQVTDNHPFWVEGKGWVDSAQLMQGMVLQSENGQALQVATLTALGRTETTYNLTVENYHTYFAGKQLALVHNCSCAVGAKNAGQGVIYKIDGSQTESRLPYIGSANDLAKRAKTAKDGRDRSNADVIGTYPIGDNSARRVAEQKAMNEHGGVSKLDNKRNEIAPIKWSKNGVEKPRDQ